MFTLCGWTATFVITKIVIVVTLIDVYILMVLRFSIMIDKVFNVNTHRYYVLYDED